MNPYYPQNPQAARLQQQATGYITDLLQQARDNPRLPLQGAATDEQIQFIAEVLRPLRASIDTFAPSVFTGAGTRAGWEEIEARLRQALETCLVVMPPLILDGGATDTEPGSGTG